MILLWPSLGARSVHMLQKAYFGSWLAVYSFSWLFCLNRLHSAYGDWKSFLSSYTPLTDSSPCAVAGSGSWLRFWVGGWFFQMLPSTHWSGVVPYLFADLFLLFGGSTLPCSCVLALSTAYYSPTQDFPFEHCTSTESLQIRLEIQKDPVFLLGAWVCARGL